MPRRPPSTHLTAHERKQLEAISFNEAAPTTPGPDLLKSVDLHQNLREVKGYLASKELEPPK
jgi:hypothetical protein